MHNFYNCAMRTTINLPDALHALVSSLAHHTGRSLSDIVVELVERGLGSSTQTAEPSAGYRVDAQTGLPVTRGTRVITPDDVARLEDEA